MGREPTDIVNAVASTGDRAGGRRRIAAGLLAVSFAALLTVWLLGDQGSEPEGSAVLVAPTEAPPTPAPAPAPAPEPSPTTPIESEIVRPSFEPSDYYTTGNPLPEGSAERFGEGAFRLSCRGGHLNYDDPIIFPGEPGASHLHQFFGNLDVDASTTLASLESSGDTTCHGGPLNRSGYWVPALIDGADDTVIPIDLVVVYYKGEPEDRSSPLMGATAPLPEDIVMVSDDYSWSCGGDRIGEGCTSQILEIAFGSCWNGVTDSADHRSHVVFPERDDGNTGQLFCPESHPTIIPRITYNIEYDLEGASASENWYLASDLDPMMAARVGQSVPAVPGSTAHGDYMEGWTIIDRETGETADRVWWEHCLLGFRDSSFGRLCDRRDLEWPGSDVDQPRVPVPAAPGGAE